MPSLNSHDCNFKDDYAKSESHIIHDKHGEETTIPVPENNGAAMF
jgi:hypothetical protein